MSSRPTKPRRSPLAFRLALLYTVFLAVSFTVLFTVIYQRVDRIMQQRDRDVIQAQVEKFSTLYRHGGEPALANYFSQPVTQTEPVFVRIVDRYNQVRFITVSHPLWNLLDQKMRKAGDIHGKSRWDMLAQEEAEGSWMVGTQPLSGGFYLQVGHSNATGRVVMAHLRRTGLRILLPALLVSLLGGWLISRSALSPLRALVDTAEHIVDTGDQKRRVPEQRQRGELAVLGALFNKVLDQNEKLVEGSREALDHVAHDLRTPMTHLRNSAEHALQAEPDLRVQREALADCMEESERILQLLNALMDLAEARSGGMALAPESCALRELADEVTELYAIVAEERNIALRNEVPTYLTVEADRMRLRQCLANLVDNALKYSGPNTTVTLGGSSSEQDVVLRVSDQGCGIGEEDMEKIWNRLYRAEPSRGTPGLGLGLSMVRAIAEAHGGTVQVESNPGEGATFSLLLPRKVALKKN
ncbi:Sensor histidine kinase ResE [Pontiella desulfatans]|uniref:histidine kinase n=1 Tax=Pontiella desulfatans TaxID=2750659 RepID=A0A6C2U8P2_PONDE|nr:HAMP domain-containing sensor histidine kinase [Pontiella desulfatans]VGO16478.1 Sensor histidine kinase ResE [Pontiella desulfatans]